MEIGLNLPAWLVSEGDKGVDYLRSGVDKFILGRKFGRPQSEADVHPFEQQGGALERYDLAGREHDYGSVPDNLCGESGGVCQDPFEASDV